MKPVVAAIVLVVCLVIGTDAFSTSSSNLPPIYDDPLLWDDLVVRGTITDVRHETWQPEDWYRELNRPGMDPVEFLRITIAAPEFLRGRAQPCELLLRGEYADEEQTLEIDRCVRPGMRVVSTARHRADINCWVATALFVENGTTWGRLFGQSLPDSLKYPEIAQRLEMVSVPTMTAESDLVLRGRIVSRALVGKPGNETQRFVVDPELVFKGSAVGQVVVDAARSFSRDESWRLLIQELEPGDSYYLFLRRDGDHFSPTAGRRSDFRAVGERLFDDLTSPSFYNPQTLEEAVRAVTRVDLGSTPQYPKQAKPVDAAPRDRKKYDHTDFEKDVDFSELVVRGVIIGLESETVPHDSLFVLKRPGESFPVTVIEVGVQGVLKGLWADATVRAVLQGDPRAGALSGGTTYDYEVGEEVVLCLHYDPKINGGEYRLWGDAGSFVKRGADWTTRRGELVSLGSVAALARQPGEAMLQCTAIGIGSIESVERKDFDCGFPITCMADYATVRVTNAWCGLTAGETIIVRALRRGSNLSWYAPMPHLVVGDTYFMFLRRDDVGYYAYGGFNGFLRVDGDALIANDYVQYPLTKSELQQLIPPSRR